MQVRSTTAPLRRALPSEPADGDFAAAGWRARPDLGELRRQHASFAELLSDLGVDVTVAPADDGLVDGCFAYDPVLVTARGSIELRMVKPARVREPARLVVLLAELGIARIGGLNDGAYAD